MSEKAGPEFDRLVEVVARLRAPDGCPWDREQTLRSLRPFVLEEAYEVLQAIDRDDLGALAEEIGDFVFEGVLLAQLASEAGHFTIADSLRSITDKLIRRHPHVFGDAARASSADEVLGRWEAIKARERVEAGEQKTILSGVPKTLPALLGALEIGMRAAAVGFDWARVSDVLAKIQEEVDELRAEVERAGGTDEARERRVEEEMGDLFFALANLSRKLGVEPESALRAANEKFSRRFTALERRFTARKTTLQEATLEEMEAEWGRIKEEEAPDSWR
jgi:ATP diphosphatase